MEFLSQFRKVEETNQQIAKTACFRFCFCENVQGGGEEEWQGVVLRDQAVTRLT